MQDRRWIYIGAIATAGIAAYVVWNKMADPGLPAGIASGNGRIEAVEIDIAAKTAGRLQDILVSDGAFIKSGQPLAQMDTTQLVANKREATAQARRAEISIEIAKSLVTQRQAERASAEAVVEQRQAELDATESKLARSEQLVRNDTISQQVLDDDRAAQRGARAALAAAQATLAASDAAIGTANMQVVDAEASVEAAKASIESVEADIADSTLKAPRDGRIQYRVAQEQRDRPIYILLPTTEDIANTAFNFLTVTAPRRDAIQRSICWRTGVCSVGASVSPLPWPASCFSISF